MSQRNVTVSYKQLRQIKVIEKRVRELEVSQRFNDRRYVAVIQVYWGDRKWKFVKYVCYRSGDRGKKRRFSVHGPLKA